MVDTNNGWQLAIIDASSGAQQLITTEQGSKRFPAWSPTGDLIAFNTVTSDNSNPDHIWIIDTNGDNLRQVTQEGKNGRPTWSPDGRYLVFNANLSGSWLLYRIQPDGSDRTAISSGGNHQRADWGN
jgi:TolB protein